MTTTQLPSNGRSHNPCREAVQERVVRQIRMLRAMWRELETGLRPLLIGHEEGNLGHSQGATYGLPRQLPTLPGVALQSPGATRFDLMLEMLALRHQLGVLARSHKRFRPADRL